MIEVRIVCSQPAIHRNHGQGKHDNHGLWPVSVSRKPCGFLFTQGQCKHFLLLMDLPPIQHCLPFWNPESEVRIFFQVVNLVETASVNAGFGLGALQDVNHKMRVTAWDRLQYKWILYHTSCWRTSIWFYRFIPSLNCRLGIADSELQTLNCSLQFAEHWIRFGTRPADWNKQKLFEKQFAAQAG